MIYNNAIPSIRTKKGDFKENIFIMLQCRTTNFNGAYLLSRSTYIGTKILSINVLE